MLNIHLYTVGWIYVEKFMSQCLPYHFNILYVPLKRSNWLLFLYLLFLYPSTIAHWGGNGLGLCSVTFEISVARNRGAKMDSVQSLD